MASVLRVKVLRKKSERLERKRWQKYVVISEKIPSIEDLLDGVYLSLRPKPSDYEVRRALVFVFNEMAKDIYGPGSDAPVVEEFGSFLMDLFTTKSDLDISVNFGNNEVQFSREKKIQKLRKFAKKLYALQREGHVYGVHPITTANVPILKVVDRGTRIECDISVENRDGVLKSKIVHMISSIDERFGKLSFLMKAWAKAQNINSSKLKTLNSLSIILLVAFHLQTRNPPILPPFSAIYKDGAGLAAVERLVHNLANYGKSNKESVAELFMTLLNKLLAVENLWCKGICASTYEGSWLSKTWDFKVACISVEDFTDRSQNVARAVGVKEVKKIYKCIHNSSQHISAFMEGQIEASTLKEYLFGRSGLSTSANGEGTKNTNKNGRRPNKEVAAKESQQTIPSKPALAGWDSSPSGNLGKSVAKVWGESTSGSWGKSVLDCWGGSTTSESSEKPTAKGWGGSTTSGNLEKLSLEKPTVKGWGGSTTSGNLEKLSLEKPTANGWEGSTTSGSWGKSTVGVWGGSTTSWSLEKPSLENLNANGWGGSQSQSWGKPAADVWGGSQSQSWGKPSADVWGGSQSQSWGKPAADVWGGSSTLGRSEKPTVKGWGGSRSTSWGKPTLDALGGSTSESSEKQTAKGWEGSLSRSWGKATVNGWGGSTTSGSLEKQTANGWGGSQSTSWGKPTVDVGGGSITSGSLEQPSLEKPTTSSWEGSQSKSLGKPVVDVWGKSASGNSEKPTAKGWGGSQSRSWEKPAVNVWRGSTSGSLEKPTAKSWGGSTSESSEKPAAKWCGGSQSRSWGKPKVSAGEGLQSSSWGIWGGSTSESSEKPTGKGCGRPQSRSRGKPTVDGWRGSTASGSSEKLTAKGWGGSHPTSWEKPAGDVGGGSTTSGSLGKQTVKGWEGSKSISWEKPTVDAEGGSQPTSWEKPTVDVGGGSTSGSLEKLATNGWGGSTTSVSLEKPPTNGWGGSTTSVSSEKPATNGWGGPIAPVRSEKRATNGCGGSTSTSWGKPTVGLWRGTAPSEGSRKSLSTKRKWSDENMGETSTGKLGTTPTNGWTGGKQPTPFKPMQRLKHFNSNWGGKNAGGWEMASQQPAVNGAGWGKWGGGT